jgi:hypothetical protein
LSKLHTTKSQQRAANCALLLAIAFGLAVSIAAQVAGRGDRRPDGEPATA